jgi:hypothetical protein
MHTVRGTMHEVPTVDDVPPAVAPPDDAGRVRQEPWELYVIVYASTV